MKKCCIITLYGNNNYGNKLQNYALQEKIKRLNHSVVTIRNFNSRYKNKILVKIINKLKSLVYTIFPRINYKNSNFREFENKYLNVSKKIFFASESNLELNEQYDYVFLGSDQIWNPEFGLQGDLKFGEFKKSGVIAYAASIGVNKLPKHEIANYRRGLSNINYISVREDSAKEIVKTLTCRKDIQVVVDPTMLLTCEEWSKVARKPSNYNGVKYILNYFLGEIPYEIKEQIDNIAKKMDCLIINVLDKNDKYYKAGPAEFVYLEQHAELICTDSFHSCVFGILMNTPFIVFDRCDKVKSMVSRIDTLLSKFNLEDRRYKGKINEELLCCDFSHCEKILNEEREKTDKFLRKALEIDNEIKE